MSNHMNSNYNIPGEYYCEYCNKLCKNLNSLKQHSIRCKNNPERINVINPGFNAKGKKTWNDGLTKQTNARLAAKAARLRARYAAGELIGSFKGKTHTLEHKQRMSALAKERQLGGFHMRRGIYYNGVKLDSSYEVAVAEELDSHNIKWTRCNRFSYTYNDIVHYYTPDFYLPDYDVYLDPKNDYLINFKHSNLNLTDIEKINIASQQNNIRVLILDKNHLRWDAIKTLI